MGQSPNISVGTVGQVPVQLLSSPIPYAGMVTHFEYDPTGIQVLGFSVPSGWYEGEGGGGGGSIGSFSEYSDSGTPLQIGDVAFTIKVRILQPGNWPISFEGNGFGLGPTTDPSQSLTYLEAGSLYRCSDRHGAAALVHSGDGRGHRRSRRRKLVRDYHRQRSRPSREHQMVERPGQRPEHDAESHHGWQRECTHRPFHGDTGRVVRDECL